MVTFGERLRATRQRRGMSQAELATLAVLSQPALSRLERGHGGPPPAAVLARLATALGVEPAWLGGEAEGAGSSQRGAAYPGWDGPAWAAGRAELAAMTRLEALAECRELRDRWLRGEARPGDPRRRRSLRAVLERTGGVPPELRWRR